MKTTEGGKLQWWKGPSLRGLTDVLLPSNMIHSFKKYLKEEEIQSEIIIRDVETAIEYSNPKLSKREQFEAETKSGHPLTFHRYHSHYDMQKFLEFIKRKYPENVDLIHIGSSYEGRPLTVVKISSNLENSNLDNLAALKNDKFMKEKKKLKKNKKIKKRAVLIEAGTNAREWLPIASSLWLIDYLAREIDKPGEAFHSKFCVLRYFVALCGVVEDLSDLRDRGPGFKTVNNHEGSH
jgi:hypothetical protein